MILFIYPQMAILGPQALITPIASTSNTYNASTDAHRRDRMSIHRAYLTFLETSLEHCADKYTLLPKKNSLPSQISSINKLIIFVWEDDISSMMALISQKSRCIRRTKIRYLRCV